MQGATNAFIETMGRHFEEEGIPRIAGRLFGLLMVNEDPCSLDEMADRLQVSKGSISTNSRLLEQWGVIERVNRPGDRRDYYRIAPDMESRMLERQMEHVARLRERLRDGLDSLPAPPEGIAERFRSAIDLQDRTLELLGEALGRVRQRGAGAGGRDAY
ncbi:MAG TPA: MarR family transcriptional regulator [Longimicrobiaceae bacterium]|nr:MarR family transcriptional regulator [Longimicrobiaceae bacterium]